MLHQDPTRTTMLRHAFQREMRVKFVSLARDVVQLIVHDDSFGLTPSQAPTFNAAQPFRFLTNDKKLAAFNSWLATQTKRKILTTDQKGQPWTSKYVESAYKKGRIRAFVDSRGKTLKVGTDFFEGSKAQFLKSAFSQPERLSKVRLLATRAFEELKGVTNHMATQMNRILSTGLVQGQNPKQIAATMVKNIKGITKTRALVIARTEVIYAHAEGQLDSFEDLGVDVVGVQAEWSTAGDDKVCPECQDMEGKVFPVSKARGMIPLHPNCRCAWIPKEIVRKRSTRKKAKKKARRKA